MCIGLPMQIVDSGFGFARCEGMGMTRVVDTLLIGDQPSGTWVLVFLNSAREVLSEEGARKIGDAISAVEQVMNSQSGISKAGLDTATIDALFADLIDREPPKPPSLMAFESGQETKKEEN